jgi:transposase
MLLPSHLKIHLASQPVDMRKSYQSLGILVSNVLENNPFCGHLFVFYNKRKDVIKILYWQTNGFCLWMKKLEKGRFQMPSPPQAPSIGITSYQLEGLIQGIDWEKIPPPTSLSYKFL